MLMMEPVDFLWPSKIIDTQKKVTEERTTSLIGNMLLVKTGGELAVWKPVQKKKETGRQPRKNV